MALMTMGLTCKICFERASDQEGGLQARITPCGHVFCAQCAATWFRSDASCPVCRYSIPAPSALIPLYDHDSGIQSPSYGLDDKLDVGEAVLLSSWVDTACTASEETTSLMEQPLVVVPFRNLSIVFCQSVRRFSSQGRSDGSNANIGPAWAAILTHCNASASCTDCCSQWIGMEESPEDCVSGDAQNGGGKRSSSQKGSPGNSEHNDRSESKKEKSGEGFSSDRSGLTMLYQKSCTDEEDLQVKVVLGKLAERWQQVVVERAKLKVQVAKLEKLKQELSSQVQSLSEENMVLKQALGVRFRPTARSSAADSNAAWDTENEVSYSGEGTLPGFDVEMSDSARPGFHPSMSVPDLSCTTETSFTSARVTRRPPVKVEERLRATKWELGHTFSMHSGPVHGIAVSPSGNLVATASWDHLCRVYDVHLEEEVSVLAGHLLGLYAVKFSPAKRDLVGTVSSDQTCRLWNTDNGECLRVLEGHTDEVNGLSFKQGTHLLATASDDKTSMIWDAEKGIAVTTLKGHRNGVYGVCFQAFGHLVATASFDFTAKLWDPRTAEDVQTLRGHQEDVIGVDIDDSGILLATGSDDKTCRVWDLRMGNPLAVLQEHSGEVKRVCFSPYGRLLATTSGDTTVRLFNTSTFECLHILSSHSDHVFDAAWSPTADFLVTASHDRLWKLWQPKVPVYRPSSLTTSFNRLRLT